MPGPVITSNLGEVTRLEGLYIMEVSPPVALKGVFLGIVSVAGTAARGPADIAVPINSPQRFVDVFGSRNIGATSGNPDSNLWTFFQKKPFGKVWVTRVQAAAAAGAILAVTTGSGPAVGQFYATSSGSYGNLMTAQVLSASDGNTVHADLSIVREGKAFRYKNVDFSSWSNCQASLSSSNLTPAAFANEPSNPVYFIPSAANFARPGNLAATNFVSGTDGVVSDSDYTTTARGLNVATNVKEAAVVLTAEYESTALKAQCLTLAGTAEGQAGKIFLVGANDSTVSLQSAVTDVASYRSDRLVYCFNHPNMIDPTTVNVGGASTLVTAPKSWMASILSQIDVDIDPGEYDTKPMLNGIFTLTNENYVREDYITMKNAGIAGLERQGDGGFLFWSAVTTNLTNGLDRISRRRMADFIEQTLTQLGNQVKKKNTLTNRKRITGAINKFLAELQGAERVVAGYKVDGDILNTDQARTQGLEQVQVKVKLVSHILELLLSLDASTNTSVT